LEIRALSTPLGNPPTYSFSVGNSDSDLRDAAVLLARAATDTGRRTDLSTAIALLGFDRRELEAELAEDLAAGRD